MRMQLLLPIGLAGLARAISADPFPLGDHAGQIWQGHPGPYQETSYRGFDPAIDPEHACAKTALIRGLPTHSVGLPNGVEPEDLPQDWTHGSTVVPSELAGFPTTTLSGVAGPVVLISDMDFTGLGEVQFDGAMRVACIRCAFEAIKLDAAASGEPELWLVDSLVDADNGDPMADPPDTGGTAALRPFDGILHALYSEILGGEDAAKLVSGHDYFRNHLHGVSIMEGAHADLMQSSGDVAGLFVVENTLDGTFRFTNATVYMGGNGAHYSDIDIVRNLISGGQNGLRISPGVASAADLLVWGNLWLADAVNVSWGVDGANGSFPSSEGGQAVTWGEGNTSTGGVVSGVDQLGRAWHLNGVNVAAVPQAEKDRIATRIQTLETWVAELRAAAPPACCSCQTSCAACEGCPTQVTPVPTPPPSGVTCSNGVDDDGDALVDFPADLGCSGPGDDSERAVGHGCDDGVDNDADGLLDFPADPGCASACSGRENPACANGLDDDGDGEIDHPADPGCDTGSDTSERSDLLLCDDGGDDDGDALVDFPADPGCDSSLDASERSAALVCDDGIDNDGDTENDFPDDPGCASVQDPDEKTAALICDDAIDNDADGSADYPFDAGCDALIDVSERDAGRPCDDGVDNDGDGASDLADAGCANPSWPSEITACSDGVDNDGDGASDFPADPECSSASVLSERASGVAACANQIDDDRDGLTDFGADPGCSAASDVSERSSALACDNGIDEDGDGERDHPDDPGCASALGASEIGTPGASPACDDDLDNDADGSVDLADPGCSGPGDASETTPYLGCDDDLDNDADGLRDHPDDLDCSGPSDVTEGVVVDAAAPQQSAVAVLASAASATLAWSTHEIARARVVYGSAGVPSSMVEESAWGPDHSVAIDGLLCDRTFWFEASSEDPTGNRSTNRSGSFSTLPCSDDEGLVGWWRLEEGSGSQAVDASGTGAAASLLGATWMLDAADRSNFSLSFDGVDDLLDLGLRNVSGTEITLAAWTKIRGYTDSDRNGRLLSKAIGSDNDQHFWMLSTFADGSVTRLRSRIRADSKTELTRATAGVVVLDRWMHAAVVYDGSHVHLYHDGVETALEAKSGALDEAPAVAVAAGNQPPGVDSRPLNGLLDDLRIYRRALSAIEIAALYGGQSMVASGWTVSTTPTTATLRWTTDQAATTQLAFGPTAALASAAADHRHAATQHVAVLTGLDPDTLYYYRTTSVSGSGPPITQDGTLQTPTSASVPALRPLWAVLLGLLIALAGRAYRSPLTAQS